MVYLIEFVSLRHAVPVLLLVVVVAILRFVALKKVTRTVVLKSLASPETITPFISVSPVLPDWPIFENYWQNLSCKSSPNIL